MSKGSTELFYLENGQRRDARLHDFILADTDGAVSADLEAVAQAVEDGGLTLVEAATLYAGGAARMELRRAGLL